MKVLNVAAGAMFLFISGCSAGSNALISPTSIANSGNGEETSPIRCSDVSGAFARGYICGRTPIVEGAKLGQDQNTVALVTAAASTPISIADVSNSGETSLIQCSHVGSAFAGGYICRRTPIAGGTKLGQEYKTLALVAAATSTPISIADSNSEEISPIRCSDVSGAFAGGYICGRTPEQLPRAKDNLTPSSQQRRER